MQSCWDPRIVLQVWGMINLKMMLHYNNVNHSADIVLVAAGMILASMYQGMERK
jgi:hypothetical protein